MPLDDEKLAEIEGLRAAEAVTTRRATVPAMEEILYQPQVVLDHGVSSARDRARTVGPRRTGHQAGRPRTAPFPRQAPSTRSSPSSDQSVPGTSKLTICGVEARYGGSSR